MPPRTCTRVSCSDPAALTLTYAYDDRMAVLGPPPPSAEPYGYDLCARHADRLRVPRGWTVVRLALPAPPPEPAPAPEPTPTRAPRSGARRTLRPV